MMHGFCSNNASYSASLNVSFYYFNSFLYLVLLQIKYQPADVYKSVFYIKACGIALQSSRHEETTLPHNFIFVFIPSHWGNIV